MTRSDYIPGPARVMLERFASEVWSAFGHPPYLVGSSLVRGDFRDVDVRVILPDAAYARLIGLGDGLGVVASRFSALNLAFSVLGERMTGLPIDFQIQEMTAANRDYPDGRRQPLVFAPGRAPGRNAVPGEAL